MKPIWITTATFFVLSPMAFAQEGHKTHDHSEKPAVEAEANAAAAKTCMAGHEGMERCMANMEGKMLDAHTMDHGTDGHQMHDTSGDHAMSPGDCQAKHEAMGHDPAEHCPMKTGR
ncbi:hypothetical protein [Hirschia baltica]|uniref:Pentapeptide MXKDX repeat protein n=1 Tax=Hirschia baltica (strain ATCC 49814 / DSM 5838 / IFAM 1418) TaxID=582402 RepID=C6XPB6_HIRBI|nr:hypothetical protein [Hirschia baltica]ACT58402.1 hypothetical protein Hbal_0705 [Hirschia baltica ATCC 49814]